MNLVDIVCRVINYFVIGLLQWARSAIVSIDGRDALLASVLKARKKRVNQDIKHQADVWLVVISLAMGKGWKILE
ncbi:hypothetical protein T4E_6026 [Trichinella pseudospiralis]|uniref:Uncharacterized protein n=1 Tax=Trichinella pseudospiralis TaxID=6337 RepID=A0A0V1FV40_TRIPS|nr:hypothetical protein T4E_6026 [Trichinella pseudospiralis]KRY89139.1 hypothetical protein T4D_9391 [Trichinella pseudospiralis]